MGTGNPSATRSVNDRSSRDLENASGVEVTAFMFNFAGSDAKTKLKTNTKH